MLQYNALFCKCQYIWLSSEDERRWGVLLSIHLHLAIVEQDVTNLFNWMVVGGGPFSVKDVLFCAHEVLLFLIDFFFTGCTGEGQRKGSKRKLNTESISDNHDSKSRNTKQEY